MAAPQPLIRSGRLRAQLSGRHSISDCALPLSGAVLVPHRDIGRSMPSDIHQFSGGGSGMRGPSERSVPHAVRGETGQPGVGSRFSECIPQPVRMNRPRCTPPREQPSITFAR